MIANSHHVTALFDVLELEALVKFMIAHRAEVGRPPLSIVAMVTAHHQAFVVRAVLQTKHVADLVRGRLADLEQELLGVAVVVTLASGRLDTDHISQ